MADGHRSEVEEFVVKGAEGDSVLFRVGAAGFVPFDVGGFESQEIVVESEVVVADGAFVVVGVQYFFPECGVSFAFPCFRFVEEADADVVEDVGMERFGEVLVEQGQDEVFVGVARSVDELVEEFVCEARADLFLDELISSDVPGAVFGELIGVFDDPKAVVSEAPEWVFRVDHGAGQAVLLEKVLEVLLDLGKRDAVLLVMDSVLDGDEQQQRFVDSVTTISLPNSNAFYL